MKIAKKYEAPTSTGDEPDTPLAGSLFGRGHEIYALLLMGAAAVGGYLLGLEGRRSASGLMVTALATLIFVIPMGFWFLFNGLAFALKGGRLSAQRCQERDDAAFCCIGNLDFQRGRRMGAAEMARLLVQQG